MADPASTRKTRFWATRAKRVVGFETLGPNWVDQSGAYSRQSDHPVFQSTCECAVTVTVKWLQPEPLLSSRNGTARRRVPGTQIVPYGQSGTFERSLTVTKVQSSSSNLVERLQV